MHFFNRGSQERHTIHRRGMLKYFLFNNTIQLSLAIPPISQSNTTPDRNNQHQKTIRRCNMYRRGTDFSVKYSCCGKIIQANYVMMILVKYLVPSLRVLSRRRDLFGDSWYACYEHGFLCSSCLNGLSSPWPSSAAFPWLISQTCWIWTTWSICSTLMIASQ